MASGIDTSNLAELRGFLGEISDEDCMILIDEFGKPGCTGADLAQIIYEELESSQFKSVTELVWHIKVTPSFINSRRNASPDKTSANGDSWNLARSKSSNTNKYTGGFSMVAQQRPASSSNQMEAHQAMPFSGTSNPIQIVRTPKGWDTSSLRLYLSKYLQDTEMRSILYDVYEKRNPKVIFLVRGASGSGKSTLASMLWAVSDEGEICSADHYFINRNGQYKFNRDSLGEAHQSCQARCRAALARGDSPVIIDNTNTMVKEMMPYVEMAVEFNYEVKMIEPKTDWKRKAGLLTQKNIHGVSKKAIELQLERFEKASVSAMVDKALKKHNMDKNNYRPNQDLDWGSENFVSSTAPIGMWSSPAKSTPPPIMPLQTFTLTPLSPSKPLPSPSKTLPSAKQKQTQSWKDPPPVAPNSPMRLSDYVPDLIGSNGNGQKSKKSGKKNGNGTTAPSTPTIQPVIVAPFFEDPAHAALEKLGRFFPTVDKVKLIDIFNSYEGDLDSCALALLEEGIEMSDITDETPMATFDRPTDDGSEDKSEEFNWDVVTDVVGSSSSNTTNDTTEVVPQRSNNGAREEDDSLYEYTFEGDSDTETSEEDPDMFNMVMPTEFARILLRAFGHPEDETRALNGNELTVRMGADTAFDLYQSLYINMHKAETGLGNAMSFSEGSTRSSSPTSTGSSADEEFDAIAISLSQMDLETTSRDPQLATIIDIESRISQQKQDSLRGYSAPYRTMAQNIQFSMLKQEYPFLDPAIVDEVFSQCMLNVGRTKSALNEMYPHLTSVQQTDKPSSSTNDTWTLKYNPKDVQLYSQEVLQSMQKTYEELEKEWTSKMTKIRDYHEKCKTMSNPQIKAHYVSEAKKLSDEMKGLADEIQYYRAIKLNAKHKNDNILDLHGLKVNGAMRVLKEFLQYKEHEFVAAGTPKMILLIITGQGKHSKNGCPILQPAVRNFLSQKTYRYHSAKPGSYTVILTRGSVTRVGMKS